MTSEPDFESLSIGFAERTIELAKKKVPVIIVDETTHKIFFNVLTDYLSDAIYQAYHQGLNDGRREEQK